MRVLACATLVGMAFGVVSPASAGYSTVDLSAYVNSRVAINAATYPVGLSTGNKSLGIPFLVASYPGGSNIAGTWNAGVVNGTWAPGGLVGRTLTVDLSSYAITGQASFYALLNNYYGTPGANEYSITINATNLDSITYSSIGGIDTRDYNANVFTNNIAATTTEWYNNGIGQRLDVREFTLPDRFSTEVISSFVIKQLYAGSYGDVALFSGLTFSSQPPVSFVPEPGGLALVGSGLLGLGMVCRRRV